MGAIPVAREWLVTIHIIDLAGSASHAEVPRRRGAMESGT
jgi:hypothetical protein